MFTPCEIVDYCRGHRGRPRQAIKKFREFVEDRISGKGEYLYDIRDDAQETKVQGEDAKDQDAKVKRLISLLPPDDPYPDSDGEDMAYSKLEYAKSPSSGTESDSSTPLKVAGSPDRSSTASEENPAVRPCLADLLRASGEEDRMFKNGHYPPEWAYKDSMGL